MSRASTQPIGSIGDMQYMATHLSAHIAHQQFALVYDIEVRDGTGRALEPVAEQILRVLY